MWKHLWLAVCLLLWQGSTQGQACIPPVRFSRTMEAPVERVVFTNQAFLPPQKQVEIANWIRQQFVDPRALKNNMSSIAEETAERVRRAFQDEGYFKAEVETKAILHGGKYDLVIDVPFPGAQYRLGKLNIIDAPSFPSAQLRGQFPIQSGEILSREKVTEGLDNLRRLYGSQGYVNSVSVPELSFDEEGVIANLTLRVDEGRQFRLRHIEILGIGPETKARVREALAMKPGDLYTFEAADGLSREFLDLVQNFGPITVDKKLDERHGLIDVVLDLRPRRVCERVSYSVPPILGLSDF